MTCSQRARSTPLGMVDEEAQRFFARLLERDQIELGVELTKLLLDVLLEVLPLVEAEKKWARPTSVRR